MSTLASVLTTRAPDAPSGWPIAIAPPRVLTRSGSTFQASRQASDWTAKASLSSTAPTSDQPTPAAPRARAAAPAAPAAPARRESPAGRLDRGDAEALRLQRGRTASGDPGQRRQPEVG